MAQCTGSPANRKGGRSSTTTPSSPTATPIQRRQPTRSFSQTAASATVSSGEAKPTAVASASGICTSAVVNSKLQAARIRLRSVCSPGARDRQGSRP